MSAFSLLLFSRLLLTFSCADSEVIFVVVDGLSGTLLARYKEIDWFSKFVQDGVWSDNLIPSFPSSTMPNLYSLVTGHHPQEHGVVADFFIDSASKREYTGGGKASDYQSYFMRSETVWTTFLNQTSVLSNWPVLMVAWPGCHHLPAGGPGGRVPRCAKDYLMHSKVDSISYQDCISQYCAQISGNMHKLYAYFDNGIGLEASNFGIGSMLDEVDDSSTGKVLDSEQMLSWLVDTVNFLNEENEKNGKLQNWNLVVAGTHGMTDIPETSRRYLADRLLLRMVQSTVHDGAFMMVEPVKGKEQEVFNRLTELMQGQNVTPYWTDPETLFEGQKLPDRFMYKKSSRIPEILLLAQPGVGIFANHGKHFPRKGDFPEHALNEHHMSLGGYDNEHPQMAAGFLAYGPAFKRGYYLDKAHTVDVYPLLCSLLNITCPQRSGRLDRINRITINTASMNCNALQLLLCLLLLLLV